MKNSPISCFRPGALIFLCFCFLLSCSKESIEGEEELIYDLAAQSAKDTTLIEGHYIVMLSAQPGKKNPRALAALEALSKEVGQMPEAKINRKYSHALTGFAAKLTDKQVDKLKKDPRIELIEQDSYVYPTGELAVQQYPVWGLDRIDQRENLLNRAYSYTASGEGVTAYIIDSGIKYSHSEFSGRAKLGYDFVLEDDSGNTDVNQLPGEDCLGHGTHVAGTVGGTTMGVAKKVNLVSVRVFGCEGGTPRSRYVAAIDWITANAVPPAVVNMSLGFSEDPENQIATDAAVINSIESGLHYTVSAGNDYYEACQNSPARVTSAITVGASDIDNNMAWFSNFGTCVDLYAPGVSILSASIEDDNSFASYNGTSMAAPHVAGVVALLLEKDPDLSPAEVHSAILENTTQNALTGVPSGTNNLLHSLWEKGEFMPPSPPDLDLKVTGDKERSNYVANLSWNQTDSQSIIIYIDGNRQWAEHYNDGEQQITLPKKGKDATYILRICEASYDNCSEEVSLIFGRGSEEEPANQSPKAAFEFSTDLLDVQFSDSSTDVDGSITAWSWDFGDGNYSVEQNPSHTFNEAGSYTVQLTVTDDTDNNGNTSKKITVVDDEPSPGQVVLSASGYKVKGRWYTDLSWTPSSSAEHVEIHRNGAVVEKIDNTGSFTDQTSLKGSGSLNYKICEIGATSSCSNEVTVQF